MMILEILAVDAVVSQEVPLHIGEEYRHIHEVFPLGAAGLQHPLDVLEHSVALGFKVKLLVVAGRRLLQARHGIRFGIARADTGKEQKIARAPGVRIPPHRLGRFGSVKFI